MISPEGKLEKDEIERQLLQLQLAKESRPWWKKQETIALTIAIISVGIAIWTFYDSHSSIDRQAENSRLEMKQLRIDLNMTAQDSVILMRNDQLRKAKVAMLIKDKDKAQLADALVQVREGSARERMRLYGQMDSLTRMKKCMPDSAALKLKDQHIKALEQMLEIANAGAPSVAALSMQARHEFTDYRYMQMREYYAQQALGEMKERLLKAEMERCP